MNTISQENSLITSSMSITPEDRLKLLAELFGFETMPPTIEEVIEDDYYLGNFFGNGILYPIWKERLKEVFPNPIETTCNIIVPHGAIGTGKSTFSQIVMLYNLIKFCCLKDPYETFRLESTTPFFIRCVNLTKEKANQVLVSPLYERIHEMPFFQDISRKFGNFTRGLNIAAAKRSGDIISECDLGFILSEINFFRRDIARELISTSISRMMSRLQPVVSIFGHCILDSSDTSEDSVINEFISSGQYAERCKVYSTTIWEAKGHLGIYFNKGSFLVYCGDAVNPPQIIEEGQDIEHFDKTRIVECPMELYDMFRLDIIKAIQDCIGLSIINGSDFFPDKEVVKSKMRIPNVLDEEIMVFDMYDSESIWDRIGKQVITQIPEDRRVYGRVDLGLTGDLAGVSLGYLHAGVRKLIGDKELFIPYIKIPISFGLSRIPGQETCIQKIIEFFVELSNYREIASVTADTYQSYVIKQELMRVGIHSELLSVDRTDSAYILLKRMMYEDRIELCDHKLLTEELCGLVTLVNKVDHKPDGSKDIADSVAGIPVMIDRDGEDAAKLPSKIVNKQYARLLKGKVRDQKLNRRNFMNSMFTR